MVVGGRLKLPNQDGDTKPCGQSQGQLEAVMRMELQFRQQVGAGNAQEGAGAKGEGDLCAWKSVSINSVASYSAMGRL